MHEGAGAAAPRAARRPALVVVAVLAVLAWLLAPVAASATSERTAPRPPSLSGWLPYWATAESVSAVTSHRGLFTEASPFWYALRKDATSTGVTVLDQRLSSGSRASVVAALHAAGVRAIPTITDGTGAHYLATQLADPRRRAAVVRALVAVVVRDGADGIDLDLEGFAFHDGRPSWPTTRPLWVAFVKELSAALGARHRVVTATIPASSSGSDGYWVYDPGSIATYVHGIRLMAYDYHVSVAGPVDPLPWVQSVVARAVATVPAAKVWLGVPAYGRSWVTATSGTCPTGTPLAKAVVTPAEAAGLAASLHLTNTWDAATAERTFAYTQTWSGASEAGARTSCRVTRTVWYDDAASLTIRAALARSAGIAGVFVWTLDDVPATAYPALAQALGRTTSAAAASTAARAARTSTASPAPTRAAAVQPAAPTGARAAASTSTPADAIGAAEAVEAAYAVDADDTSFEAPPVSGMDPAVDGAEPGPVTAADAPDPGPATTVGPAGPAPAADDGAVASPAVPVAWVRTSAAAVVAAVAAALLGLMLLLPWARRRPSHATAEPAAEPAPGPVREPISAPITEPAVAPVARGRHAQPGRHERAHVGSGAGPA